MRLQRYIAIALSADVLATALKVSAVVGSILTAINHGPAIWQGRFDGSSVQGIQVVLCYVVPYCVSTYSAVCAVVQRENH